MWYTKNTSHVTHMNESCQVSLQERMSVISSPLVQYIWMGHMTRMNESCHTYNYESWHTYEWVVSGVSLTENVCHTITSGTRYMNESHDTYEWVMWHIQIRVMSHIWMSLVRCLSNRECLRHHRLWYNTYEWVTWHIWMSHVTHKITSHGTHMNESCQVSLQRTLSVTTSPMVQCIWMRNLTHIHEPCHTYEWVMSHMHVTHVNESCFTHKSVTHKSDTGWWRLIGSPKLQIIFHKRAAKYKSLLRKMTYKDKGSYESSPPCTCGVTDTYEWVVWHIQIRVMSHIWMRNLTHTLQPCHTYEWVRSRMRVSHVLRIEVLHIKASHIWARSARWYLQCVCHDSIICDVTHVCVYRYAYERGHVTHMSERCKAIAAMRVPWLRCLWRDSCMCVMSYI